MSNYIIPESKADRDYIAAILKMPMLTAEEEKELFVVFRAGGKGSRQAKDKIIQSHMKLAVAMANKQKGYGLPMDDLASEALIGLIQAVDKFDATKKCRLATYASFWIRAAIGEYILKNWSMVKMGTTTQQKKLFSNLRKVKNALGVDPFNNMSMQDIQKIADSLGVTADDVIMMDQRLVGKDASLNAPMTSIGGDTSNILEKQDFLADPNVDTEQDYIDYDQYHREKFILDTAMARLPELERSIIQARRIDDPPKKLRDLAKQHGISGEWARQVEIRAFAQLKAEMLKIKALS